MLQIELLGSFVTTSALPRKEIGHGLYIHLPCGDKCPHAFCTLLILAGAKPWLLTVEQPGPIERVRMQAFIPEGDALPTAVAGAGAIFLPESALVNNRIIEQACFFTFIFA